MLKGCQLGAVAYSTRASFHKTLTPKGGPRSFAKWFKTKNASSDHCLKSPSEPPGPRLGTSSLCETINFSSACHQADLIISLKHPSSKHRPYGGTPSADFPFLRQTQTAPDCGWVPCLRTECPCGVDPAPVPSSDSCSGAGHVHRTWGRLMFRKYH